MVQSFLPKPKVTQNLNLNNLFGGNVEDESVKIPVIADPSAVRKRPKSGGAARTDRALLDNTDRGGLLDVSGNAAQKSMMALNETPGGLVDKSEAKSGQATERKSRASKSSKQVAPSNERSEFADSIKEEELDAFLA